MLNLRQMEVFRAVMRQGSVTGAARILNVAQPSVSQLLRHTEKKLGFALFERTAGRLRPTPAAQQLFRSVERVFEQVERVNYLARNLANEHRTSLRIGCLQSLSMILADIAAAFSPDHPQTTAGISVLRPQEIADGLVDEHLDVGIGIYLPRFPGLVHRELSRRHFLCVVPTGHPLNEREVVDASELTRYPLIGYTARLPIARSIRSGFDAIGLRYKPVCEVEQMMQAWSLAQAGVGIAITDPFSSLGDFFPNARALPLRLPASVTLNMVCNRDHANRPVIAAFSDFLADYVAKRFPTIERRANGPEAAIVENAKSSAARRNAPA